MKEKRKVLTPIEMIRSRLLNKSYKKKYRYYYLLTFIIPIVVILIVNVISQNNIKQQVIRSNEKTLAQFFHLIDENVKIMVDDAYSLMMTHDLAEYANLNEKETITEYRKKISIISSMSDMYLKHSYKDVIVWFPKSDRIISGANPITSSDNLEKYCNMFYSEVPFFKEKIQDLEYSEAFTPVFWPIEDEDGEQYLAISINRYQPKSNLPNYVLTLVVNDEFISQCIGDGVLSTDENAMLFNQDGDLLFSHKNEKMEHLSEQYRKAGVYEISISGQPITLLIQESKCMNGFYAMTISHHAFFEHLVTFKFVSIFGILLSIVLGFFVMCIMSKKTYQPLENVLIQLQNNTMQSFNSKEQSEFEFFSNFLSEQKSKEIAYKAHSQKVDDARKRNVLLQIALEGREMNPSELSFLQHNMDMPLFFYGGILQLSDCGVIGWNLLSFTVTSIFTEAMEDKFQCNIIPLQGTRYMIVCGAKNDESEKVVESLILNCISVLSEKFRVESVFAMGTKCQEIYGLCGIFRQAQRALEYYFLLPNERIIKYEKICHRQMKMNLFENSALFPAINEFMQSARTEKFMCESFVDNLLNKYEICSDAAIESVNCFRYEMLSALNRIWIGKDLDIFKCQEYVEALLKAEKLDEYRSRLVDILYEAATAMRECKRRESLCARVKKYVEDNYSNEDLNVSHIGAAIGKQPAYLSRLFQEEYGFSLPYYISLVRINQSKILLKDSKLSIEKIAKLVGFSSSSVFIRTFKKYEGLTPGIYAELIEKKY